MAKPRITWMTWPDVASDMTRGRNLNATWHSANTSSRGIEWKENRRELILI